MVDHEQSHRMSVAMNVRLIAMVSCKIHERGAKSRIGVKRLSLNDLVVASGLVSFTLRPWLTGLLSLYQRSPTTGRAAAEQKAYALTRIRVQTLVPSRSLRCT